jgi:ribosomal protein S18 acetylase RimI-like enzyme
MITRTTKTQPSILGRVADLALGNVAYLNDTFPESSNREKLLTELTKSREAWNIFSIDEPAALFRLYISDKLAVLDKFLSSPALPFEAIIGGLKKDLEKMKVESLTLQVPKGMTEILMKNEFQKLRILMRLSGPVVETNRMPILPLNNPAEKDVPALAKLMHESYEKTSEKQFLNLATAESLLRGTMGGARGPYVTEASLMSGIHQNVVSACLVTLSSPRVAEVTQLFTHPLYRARGLATTEVATSMNKLAKRDVQTLTVLVNEGNDIARRLFAKLGFREDRSLVEMRTSIP